MRKYLFFVLFILFFINSGCRLNTEVNEEEVLLICLPSWPPQDSFSDKYPALSRWKITITSSDFQESFFTTDDTVKILIKKNRPFCLQAQPLTLLENGKECAYFMPAGFLYPWSSEISNNARWEEGFLAEIMTRLFQDAKENCMQNGDTAWIASTFNWKKAQETIDKKISESKSLPENPEEKNQKFYNPWLIPSTPILENISASQFKSSLLNLTGCYTVSTDFLEKKLFSGSPPQESQELPLLSSFIPENSCLLDKKQFTVRKDSQILVSSAKKHGILITFHSSKNISLAFIFLPIYIEDI